MLTPVTLPRPPGPLCDEVVSSTPADGSQIEMTSPSLQIETDESSSDILTSLDGSALTSEEDNLSSDIAQTTLPVERTSTVLDLSRLDYSSTDDGSLTSGTGFVTGSGSEVLESNLDVSTLGNEEVNQYSIIYASGDDSISGEESVTPAIESGRATRAGEDVITSVEKTTTLSQEVTNSDGVQEAEISGNESNASVEDLDEEFTSSGESTSTLGDNSRISVEDEITSGEDEITSGEDIIPDLDLTTSGEDIATSDVDVIPSSETVTILSEDVTPSDEEATALGEEATISGEEVTSGEYFTRLDDNLATTGKDARLPGGKVSIFGEEVTTSGEEVITTGEEATTSGEEVITSGEEVITSSEKESALGKDVFTSRTVAVTLSEEILTSGDDAATLSESIAISGDDVATSSQNVAISGDDVPTSREDSFTTVKVDATSGEDVSSGEDVASGEDAVTAVEDIAASGQDVATSGEGVLKPGDDVITLGGDIDSYGETGLMSGEGTAASGEGFVTYGEDTDTSGEDFVTQQDEIVASNEGTSTLGEIAVTSGERLDTSDEDTVTSDDKAVTSGEDTIASGEQAVTSGEDIFSAGEFTTMSNKDIHSDMFSPDEEPAINVTTVVRESNELEVKIDQGVTKGVSSGQAVVTSATPVSEETGKMIYEGEEESKPGKTSQGTTLGGGEKMTVSGDVTPGEKQFEVETTTSISQTEGQLVHVDTESVLTTSRDMAALTSERTTLSSRGLTTVTKHVSSEEEAVTDLAICIEADEGGFSSFGGGVIAILNRIKNLISKTNCKTPDAQHSTTSVPSPASSGSSTKMTDSSTTDHQDIPAYSDRLESASSGGSTKMTDSSTTGHQDRATYSDRLESASTAVTSSAHREADSVTSAIPILLTSNGVRLKDGDHITVTASVDEIIKAFTIRKPTSRKPKPSLPTRAGVSFTESTTEYTSTPSDPLLPLLVLTHGVETATLGRGKLLHQTSGLNETKRTTKRFQQASRPGRDDEKAKSDKWSDRGFTEAATVRPTEHLGTQYTHKTGSRDFRTLSSLAVDTSLTSTALDQTSRFSTKKPSKVTRVPAKHAIKTPSSQRRSTATTKDVTERPGIVSTTLETFVILLYDTLPTATTEEPTALDDVRKTKEPLKEPAADMGTTTAKDFTLGGTESGIHLLNKDHIILSAEGTTQRMDNTLNMYNSTKSAAVTDKGYFVDINIEKKDTTASHERGLRYTGVVDVSTRSNLPPTDNAAIRNTRRPLSKKPPIFRGQGRLLHSSKFPSRKKPPISHTPRKESKGEVNRQASSTAHPALNAMGSNTNKLSYNGTGSSPSQSVYGRPTEHSQGGVRQGTSETRRQNTTTFTIYGAVKDALFNSNETAVQSYSRTRQKLRQSLEQLAKLWRSCVQGVVEVVYVPSVKRFVDYGTHLNVAYKNIKKAYEYGSSVLHKTYYAASQQITKYYTGLIDYFNTSYSYYYDLFQASWRR
ncbi:hypothetical protein BsWGS_08254 [Bradybaena similaris]